MSEIRVSPIDGDNVLIVNGFRIVIAILNAKDNPALAYHVERKGTHITTFEFLQQAAEWCSD